ncbi:MAG: hypothetical protein J0H75_15425 [Rhizobiales bacterium]|nr:hypothetical protein [Hyphomicrobiales bacterium]
MEATTGSLTMSGHVIDWGTLHAGTLIDARATGAVTFTTVTSGRSIDMRSSGSAVNLGTVTSGGSQTVRAASDVLFSRLTATGTAGDAGNIDVTADTGAVRGTTIEANGSAALTAATANNGTSATATTGSLAVSGGAVDWGSLNAGTLMEVRATNGAVNLGTAISGGSQTISAAGDVTFASLTTSGIIGDVGNIGVTAAGGAIQGGTIVANGSAILTAATSNTGANAAATTGSLTLAGASLIDWSIVNADTTMDVRSTGGAICVCLQSMRCSWSSGWRFRPSSSPMPAQSPI